MTPPQPSEISGEDAALEGYVLAAPVRLHGWQAIDPVDALEYVDASEPFTASEATYAGNARAKSTLRGYKTDWLAWCNWCEDHDMRPLPADPVALTGYISALADAGRKTGTISRRLSSIRFVHRLWDLDDPTTTARVQQVWEGIRRTIAHSGTAQANIDQAPPLMPPQLWDAVDACPSVTTWKTRTNQPSLAGARDRALLLVGFFGALRRDELARLDVSMIRSDPPRGLVLELPWSKTNQRGDGSDLVALPRTSRPDYCPVTALERWLVLAGITHGRVFRSIRKDNHTLGAALTGDAINTAIINACKRAHLSPAPQPATPPPPETTDSSDGQQDTDTTTKYSARNTPCRAVGFSAHSLRAGFVTYAHLRGNTTDQIRRQTRHRSAASVDTYTRLNTIWDSNAVTNLGL